KLSGMTGLRELYLPGPVWNPGGGNEEASGAFKAISTLTGLQKLYVGWHFNGSISIRDNEIKQLLTLTDRRDFRCSQCRLTNLSLAPWTKLQSLDLSNNGFTDAALAGLAEMKNLRHLLLRDSMITDEGLKHLAGLTSLEELDLSGTRITDRGIENL